ncbi:hypothetical protein F9B85_07735 [Heliorestis acidaminivorans]|uniref:DUF4013 domain-containing protein n=1 Tax=Heliorestis acidaminivorans TaxID=553427 RepID=A0A6I0F2G6_9FIRM|nr:hypothetical protein [Heliorestis acidaminivorans]KAB2952548.1 hypothetical protein F9B85_07735 [Heliorestis acidaminivorans]
MSYSLYHDLLLPFQTPAMNALAQGLFYLPLLLFACLLPFLQAGLIAVLRDNRHSRQSPKKQIHSFIRGIADHYLYCWALALLLAPLYAILFWLTFSFGTINPNWTIFSWLSYLLAKVLLFLLAFSFVSFIADKARLALISTSCCSNRKPSALANFTVAFPYVIKHYFSLLTLRGIVYILAFLIIALLYSLLMNWPGGGWTSLYLSFFLQQLTVLILIWARLIGLVIMDEYIQVK